VTSSVTLGRNEAGALPMDQKIEPEGTLAFIRRAIRLEADFNVKREVRKSDAPAQVVSWQPSYQATKSPRRAS
jgi:hypothetical protein